MAAFNKYNGFVLDVASGLHQMQTGTSHVYKVYLTNTLPIWTATSDCQLGWRATPAQLTLSTASQRK